VTVRCELENHRTIIHGLAPMDLAPELQPGTYVFCVDDGRSKVSPVATIREREGLTIVLAREEADQARLPYDLVHAWITLNLQTALDHVGVTARFSAALADGIACNVIAGFHHDHLFVPAHRGNEALAILRAL
jgi:hypothetical protein